MKKREKEKETKKQSDLVTKESLGAVCALFSLLALLILFTRSLIFGNIGIAIHSFLLGLFGYFAYPLLFAALYLSVTSLIGLRLVKNRKVGVCVSLALIFAMLFLHTITTYTWELEGYVVRCFEVGERFPAATVCGCVGGVFVYAISSATSALGATILFSALLVFFGYLSSVLIKKSQEEKAKTPKADSRPVNSVDIPLSKTQSEPQTAVREVAPTEVAPQFTYAQQQHQQTASTHYEGATVEQRPGVRLPDEFDQESASAASGAFSPFGTPQNMRPIQSEDGQAYRNNREFLFGGTPAENYQRNLIFDPNSRVNKRPAADPEQTPVIRSEYTRSYSEEYQSSVNAGSENARPVKLFDDRVLEERENAYDQRGLGAENNTYSARATESIEPLQPIEETPVLSQEPVSYPTYQEEERREDPYTISAPQEERYERAIPEEPTSESGEEYRRHDYMDLFSPSNPNVFGSENEEFADETFSRRDRGEREDAFERGNNYQSERVSDVRIGINVFDEDVEERESDPYSLRSEYSESRGDSFETSRDRGEEFSELSSRDYEREDAFPDRSRFDERDGRGFVDPTPESEIKVVAKPTPTPPPPPKPRVIRPYKRVPLDDFDCRDIEPSANADETEETKETIISTLEDFNITGATIASVTVGPTVTRYNIALPRTVPPKKVISLEESIALSLHAAKGVNIYPNYEDGVVSIEVPNKDRQFVQLGCMLTGDTFVNSKPSSLMFTMGKDVGNRKVYGDISKMIHLLVAGSSGSGKSVFLGSLIVSLIYKYSPEELRLILIDPKKTEFVLYNNLPHLMINEIITDVNKAVQSLNWAIGEMNRRYTLFEQMSRAGTYVVNLDEYNAHMEKAERLPKIVIIIDELADLMLAAKKDIEDRIQNLTQKARAAGIHLIVATQRPSTDVITGVIKSNLATRIAFAVATDVDSRVILDQSGAQNLLGKGDFLYTMQGINTPVRVQSAFISSEDSQRVVNFIKSNNEAYFDETVTSFINNARSSDGGNSFGGSDEVEPIYIEALRFVILSESASISMIQRKCSVGYNKAGKIVEWMEDMGYISSFDGAKARKVLITKEEFESKYGSL